MLPRYQIDNQRAFIRHTIKEAYKFISDAFDRLVFRFYINGCLPEEIADYAGLPIETILQVLASCDQRMECNLGYGIIELRRAFMDINSDLRCNDLH